MLVAEGTSATASAAVLELSAFGAGVGGRRSRLVEAAGRRREGFADRGWLGNVAGLGALPLPRDVRRLAAGRGLQR
jgi:hypothetical protein